MNVIAEKGKYCTPVAIAFVQTAKLVVRVCIHSAV